MIGVKLLDRYQLVEQIGHGGMGVVYRAHDPLLDREVAVKMLPPGVLRPETEERFRREARLVAQMDHPGIVPIFDFGQYIGSLFLIMPVVHGTTLRKMIESGALHAGEVLEIVAQSAEALDYSHARGVVHRDIKPENIMVSPDREHLRVRLMDFGLARDVGNSKLTHSGGIVGTLGYMSPEQIQGGAVGAAADLYALGAVLYECLAGEAPFVGPIYSLVPRIVQEEPRSLQARGVEVDQELDELILGCLAKDPSARPPDAHALATALRRAALRLGGEFLGRVLGAPRPEKVVPLAPLFGRQAELQAVLDRLPAVLAGDSQLILLEGEAGMGKTRFLDELALNLRPRGLRLLRGRLADRQSALPYQGLCELVQDGLRSRETNVTSAAVGELAELATELVARFPLLAEVDELRSMALAKPDAAPPASPLEIAQLFARTLQRLALGRSLAIFLEDIHLGDTSLDALEHLVAFLAGSPTLLVFTWRPGEVEAGSRLAQLLARWRQEPRCLRLRLEGLAGEDFSRLAHHLLGAENVAAATLERLREASEGNPLFLRELIRSWRDTAELRRASDGSWSFSESHARFSGEALPEAVQEAVARHLDHLPSALRRLLELAAVLGRRFDFDDLVVLVGDDPTARGPIDAATRERALSGALSGAEPVEQLVERQIEREIEITVEKRVESLLQAGILVEERRGALCFASLLHREVLYHRLSRRERRQLHRKAAELIERRGGARAEKVLAQLFHHCVEAELAEKSVTYGVELARRALAHARAEEARTVASRALEQIEDDPERLRWHGELLLLLAEAQRQLGELTKALMASEQAFQAFDGADLLAEAADAAAFVAETAWHARQADLARLWTERGLELVRAALAGPAHDGHAHVARGEAEEGARGAGSPPDAGATLERLLVLGATVANLRGEHEEARLFLEELERRQGAAATEETLVAGGTLRMAMAAIELEIDPLAAGRREELELAALVFDVLLERDGETSSPLVESVLMAADGRRCELRLRAGVTFSDGAPLTAIAVKLSLERAARARRGRLPTALAALDGIGSFIHGQTDELRGLEATDERTLHCELSEPLPIFPSLLSDPTLMVVREVVDAGGHRLLFGSGAFALASLERNGLVLQRRRAESGASRGALLDRIEVELGLDSALAAAALRSGDLDLAGDFRAEEVEALARDLRARGSFVELPRQSVVFAMLRATLSPEIRAMLCSAIDVLELTRQASRLAQPAFGLLPPGLLGHDPGRRPPPRLKLDLRPRMGAAAGYSAIALRAGLDLRLWQRHQLLFERLALAWQGLGFEVDWQFFDLPPRADRADYDVLFVRATAASDDPDELAFGLFHSQRGRLRAYYGSADDDLLLEEARVDTRPASRVALYRRFEDALCASDRYLPLFYEIDSRFGGKHLRHLRLSPRPPFIDYWHLAKAGATEETPATRPARGGDIQIPIPGRPEDLDPRKGLYADHIEVMATVFETLTRVEEGAHIVPWLAESWEARGGGGRYQFKLRDGVRFHDGRRLSTRDVRFSFERLLRTPNPEVHFPLLPIRGARAFRDGTASSIAGIELVSSQELLLELEQPIGFFPALLSHALTAIVPEGTEKLRGTWRDGCVGTGPFRVVFFDPGKRLELERNPDFWKPNLPKADRLSFRLGLSPEKIAEDFRLGRLSLASDLRPDEVEALRRDPVFAAGYRDTPRLATYFLVLDARHPPFSDRDLRLAFVRSLDLTAPLQAAGRLAVRAHRLIPPGLLGYEAKPPMPAPAPGEPVTLASFLRVAQHPVWSGAYAPYWEKLRATLRASWYEMDAMAVDPDQAMKIFRDGAADLLAYRWVADYPDTDGFLANLVHSEEGSLGDSLQRPEIDGAIERARTETDPSLRHVLYREIDDLLVREGLIVPLFHEQIYRFRHPSIRGFRFGPGIPEVRYEEMSVRR